MSRELPHPIEVKEGLPTDVRTIEEVRGPDAAWHFRLAVRWPCDVAPLDADPVPALGEPKRLLLLRRDNPPHDIQVVGHFIDVELDPHHFLEDLLREQGRHIVSVSPIPLASGVAGDMVATWEHEGAAYAGRFFASKWGTRIFVVSAQSRRDHYARIADDFFDTIASFEAIEEEHGDTGPLGELVQRVDVEQPVAWRSVVPDSWRVQLSPPEGVVAGFTASNIDGDLSSVNGMLSVGVAKRKVAKKPRKAARMYLDAIKFNDIDLEHQDFLDEPTRKPYRRTWCCVTNCMMGDAPGEMRCRVMMSKQFWVVAGLLGPRRADDPVAWMRNKRAFDLATESLEIEP